MKRLTLIDKAFILKASALFAQLDLDLLLAIADKLSITTVDSGDEIFTYGEDAYRMYFTVKGTVTMRDQQERTLAVLHPSDFFGDEALFSDKPREYSAVAQTDAVLLTLSRTNLLTIISECPTVAIGLLQAYAVTTPFRYRKPKPEGRR